MWSQSSRRNPCQQKKNSLPGAIGNKADVKISKESLVGRDIMSLSLDLGGTIHG